MTGTDRVRVIDRKADDERGEGRGGNGANGHPRNAGQFQDCGTASANASLSLGGSRLRDSKGHVCVTRRVTFA